MRRYLTSTLLIVGALARAQNIFTVAGLPYGHRHDVDSQPSLAAPLGSVYGLLIDKRSGRLIFNDELLAVRLEEDGSLLALAGSGMPVTRQFIVAGSPLAGVPLASALSIGVLRGMAQDASGALYLADAAAGRVYRVAPDGTVTTFAGGGIQPPGFQSDGGPATAAQLQSPRGLAFDSQGRLNIAEVFCNCIRQVTPDGIISTLYTLPPSPAPGRLPNIEGLAIDAQDNLYFTEWSGNVVVKMAADGSSVTTLAGTGSPGFDGDGGPASSSLLSGPSGVTLDARGNVYIADTMNHRIRRIAADGTISTIAGTGACEFSGDGGPAAMAQLCQPAQIVIDAAGSLMVADYGNRRVRQIAADGTITTIAGNGQNAAGLSDAGSSGNGGPAIHATFNLLGGVAFDTAGNLYASESLGNVIRKISPSGVVSTIAGTGQAGATGDGGPATGAQLAHPGPLSVGPGGAIYVTTGDSRIRKITPDGNISLVAGSGTGTGIIRSQGDGGLAVKATLNEPGGVAFDGQGNIYIADTSNARVRKIDQNGIITTVAGPGQQGVDYYNAVAVDSRGNLYVAWTHAEVTFTSATVNRVNPGGSLTPVAGNGQPCTNGGPAYAFDGMPATEVPLCAVVALGVDPGGRLILSEGLFALLLRLNSDGTIQRVAGDPAAKDLGDGGPALQARLVGGQGWSPGAVTFDPAGNLYFPEPGLNVIREVTATPYTVQATPSQIVAVRPANQMVTVSGNFAEPFPYSVRVSSGDGGSWLSVNRVTGLLGESITVNVNPAGLMGGVHRGTIAIMVAIPAGGAPHEVDVPVTLTLP